MADYKNRLDEFLTRCNIDLKTPQRCVSGTHPDNHPSMYRHNEEWWHCFSCGKNFNIYHFAARKIGVNLDKEHFRAVSECIEDTLGIPRPVNRHEKIAVEIDELDAALKTYISEYGTDDFAVKVNKINFSDKLLKDLDNSQIGVMANAIMKQFKDIPLTGNPNSDTVFSDYFCNNFYPHIIYTSEIGFYIYNYETGVFQTQFTEAVIYFILRMLAKRIENFDISTSKKIAGILELISMHPLVQKTEAAFDQDDFLLNAQGVIYNLKTLESKPATPDMPMKMTTSVRPKKMETPVFDNFLAQITNNDPAMQAYLLRYMGYALTGITREQIFLDFFGGGKNGKTTFIELMLYIFGTYATTVSDDLIIDTSSPSKSENAAADLQNKRLATLADCNYGTLNDSMIKRVTGGDTIRARHLYKNSFEFTPKSKLIIGTNKKLHLRDTGESIKRRLKLVPFEFIVKEKDGTLPERLRGEAEGILHKLIREAYDYLYTNTLPVCPRIDNASKQYINTENPFTAFFEECLKFDPAFSVKTVEVWNAYKAWAEANDVKLQKKQLLIQELESRGVYVLKTMTTYLYKGIIIQTKEN
ncbi:MAG: DUF5906 domain-containing protein [Treponema sp.]|jgi:putative DNA primase/helicase|nr:DUF5906 domain-containing protein [Treponema sp.]